MELVASKECEDWGGEISLHSTICPLGFFDDIQTRVDDELVHVLRGVREPEAGNAIAATFRCAEGDVEYRGISW